jgi:undecaprenyl-diphosphatase
MDIIVQAIVMGIVQGLTEFLPVSSSGHLILVPSVLGWDDEFLNSLAYSVVIHLGTLVALLVYFRHDWVRLVPAGLAALRDRSFRDDPDRRLAWLIASATIPAAVIAFLLSDFIATEVRRVGFVVFNLVLGGVILWLADRWGSRVRHLDELRFRGAVGIGFAQALALLPGISRSGISMSAALFAGLDRASAARFSFLMATPITALAIVYELVQLVTGDAVAVNVEALVAGVLASFVSGILAIAVLLRYLRTRSFSIFVAYRFAAAGIVILLWLGG